MVRYDMTRSGCTRALFLPAFRPPPPPTFSSFRAAALSLARARIGALLLLCRCDPVATERVPRCSLHVDVGISSRRCAMVRCSGRQPRSPRTAPSSGARSAPRGKVGWSGVTASGGSSSWLRSGSTCSVASSRADGHAAERATPQRRNHLQHRPPMPPPDNPRALSSGAHGATTGPDFKSDFRFPASVTELRHLRSTTSRGTSQEFF